MTIQEIEQNINLMSVVIKDAQEALNKYQKALAELKESKKEGKWKPAQDDEFWFRGINGASVSEYYLYDDNDSINWRINNLPVFKTKEECERYWHFMDTVKEKSYEFSKEEWENGDILKNFIYYDSLYDTLKVDFEDICKSVGTIYFKTKEDAQYIIDNFKEELMEYWI